MTSIILSDPLEELPRVRFATLKSQALGRRVDVTLYAPTAAGDEASPLPLLLLLHGAHGSHWNWVCNGGVHRRADRLIEQGRLRPLVIAMPSDGLWGDGSAYLPSAAGDAETWIIDELIPTLTAALPGLTPSSPHILAGLSMGGFGALRLGAKYATRFAGISAHSAVTALEDLAEYVEELPPAGDKEEPSPLEWMLRNRTSLPPLRFDCGKDDPLAASNRRFHHALAGEGIPHSYHEYEGGHTWDYWREQVTQSLLFVEKCCESATASR